MQKQIQGAVDLAVVGGGSTAVSLLAQLVQQLQHAETAGLEQITIFEPSAEIGPGEPYGSDSHTNLLNIPAGKMSAYAEDRGHFFRWMKEQGCDILEKYGADSLEEDKFLPRPMFGEYLQAVWLDLVEQAGAMGIHIHRVKSRVTDIARDPESRIPVVDADGVSVHARRVVMCNGNLPSVSYAELQGQAGYFHSPYPVNALVADIPKEASVAVIGSSLSAIDTIVALREAGHTGRLIAVSRNGKLPSVRSAVAPLYPVVPPTVQDIVGGLGGGVTGLTLDDLFSFLSNRIRAFGGTMEPSDFLGLNAGISDALEYEISLSSSQPRLWQSVAISLNEVIEHVWHMLPESERKRLYEEWRGLWMTRRATFPLVNAKKIKHYLEAGNFEILGGGAKLEVLSAPAGGFEIHIPHDEGVNIHRVGYLINATGMSTDVNRASDPLVTALLASGTAVADPYGGFKLDFDTGCLVDAQGCVQNDISVLGSLASGTYFWTMSLDVNARLALDQARSIAKFFTLSEHTPA